MQNLALWPLRRDGSRHRACRISLGCGGFLTTLLSERADSDGALSRNATALLAGWMAVWARADAFK